MPMGLPVSLGGRVPEELLLLLGLSGVFAQGKLPLLANPWPDNGSAVHI
jgi:hypothetical protein